MINHWDFQNLCCVIEMYIICLFRNCSIWQATKYSSQNLSSKWYQKAVTSCTNKLPWRISFHLESLASKDVMFFMDGHSLQVRWVYINDYEIQGQVQDCFQEEQANMKCWAYLWKIFNRKQGLHIISGETLCTLPYIDYCVKSVNKLWFNAILIIVYIHVNL